ncbi:FxsA family protein [Candidatus Dependentiae bacterium]|nr:FxsA family protein [Candidatus Dependentiae bacterium]
MLWKLILAFTVIPIIELYILLMLADLIGPHITILIIILTGITGGILTKAQGLNTIKKIKTQLAEGDVPTDELLNGLLILSGGLLLLTPGILTDLTGFTLLIPFTRTPIRNFLKKKFKKIIEKNTITFNQ